MKEILVKMDLKDLEKLKEKVSKEIKTKGEEEEKRRRIKDEYAIVEPQIHYELSYPRL